MEVEEGVLRNLHKKRHLTPLFSKNFAQIAQNGGGPAERESQIGQPAADQPAERRLDLGRWLGRHEALNADESVRISGDTYRPVAPFIQEKSLRVEGEVLELNFANVQEVARRLPSRRQRRNRPARRRVSPTASTRCTCAPRQWSPGSARWAKPARRPSAQSSSHR